ncbi:unnamed protein product [Ilex paraguariensis]|uniref:Uncharacterized protein n=1 Tax=Ilex paraguariensis TaxID=185542 RepID=A0ABC8U7X3_9AQUA
MQTHSPSPNLPNNFGRNMADSSDHSHHTSDKISKKDKKEAITEDSKLEFSEDEEMLIARMFRLVGERWCLIAGRIPGRTAEEIKKYWTSRFTSSSDS